MATHFSHSDIIKTNYHNKQKLNEFQLRLLKVSFNEAGSQKQLFNYGIICKLVIYL